MTKNKSFTLLGFVSLVAILALLAVPRGTSAEGVSISSPTASGETLHANVTAAYSGAGPIRQVVYTLTAMPVTVIAGVGITNGYGGTKVVDFPDGRILIEGVVVNLQVDPDSTTLDDADGGNLALGTVVAGVVTGALGFVSTQADLCPNVSIDPITNFVQSALVASAHFDGTTTAKDMFCNVTVDSADATAQTTNTVSGNITCTYIELGDFSTF